MVQIISDMYTPDAASVCSAVAGNSPGYFFQNDAALRAAPLLFQLLAEEHLRLAKRTIFFPSAKMTLLYATSPLGGCPCCS
jgi:hypothetical protein